MKQRQQQQIAYPIDEASLRTIGAVRQAGPGTTALTEVFNVSGGGGGSVTGPKSYVATLVLVDTKSGTTYEVPVVARSNS
jgi:hypothetical protein